MTPARIVPCSPRDAARERRDAALREAVVAGRTAAAAGVPAHRNPHDDFGLGAAWALGWHELDHDQGPVPTLIRSQARLAGVL